jgi:hypothetical protein
MLKDKCKDEVDVIIIDKAEGAALAGASYGNGGFHHVALETWTNFTLFKRVLKSLYTKDTNVVLTRKGLFY